VQRAGAITDVTGDTEQCKEMLLKPLGFRWERSLKVWRWDGNGDDSRDPTNELLVRAARDGVQVTHVKFRPAVAQKSARAILASLMADVESPSPASAAAPALLASLVSQARQHPHHWQSIGHRTSEAFYRAQLIGCMGGIQSGIGDILSGA
jgi:hypothetical protein